MKFRKRTVVFAVVVGIVIQMTTAYCGTIWDIQGEGYVHLLMDDPTSASFIMQSMRAIPNAEYAKKLVDTGNMPAEYVQELKDMGLIAADYGTSAPVAPKTEPPKPVEQAKETPPEVLKSFTVEPYDATMWAISTANIRQGAAKDFPQIGSLKKDEEVKVIGRCVETSWYQISFGAETGFVSNTLLTTQKPITEEIVSETVTVEETIEPTSEVVTEVETVEEVITEEVTTEEVTTAEIETEEPTTEAPTTLEKTINTLPIVIGIVAILIVGGMGFLLWKKKK